MIDKVDCSVLCAECLDSYVDLDSDFECSEELDSFADLDSDIE